MDPQTNMTLLTNLSLLCCGFLNSQVEASRLGDTKQVGKKTTRNNQLAINVLYRYIDILHSFLHTSLAVVGTCSPILALTSPAVRTSTGLGVLLESLGVLIRSASFWHRPLFSNYVASNLRFSVVISLRRVFYHGSSCFDGSPDFRLSCDTRAVSLRRWADAAGEHVPQKLLLKFLLELCKRHCTERALPLTLRAQHSAGQAHITELRRKVPLLQSRSQASKGRTFMRQLAQLQVVRNLPRPFDPGRRTHDS